ncbi:DUF3265 domain-containing protein [Vibrio parahaemolyticus]|nr:DUF3265 domain-containing protein [Vibrio parahaemolyticus]
MKAHLTNNLRVIQHAWHFWSGLSLVIKAFNFRIVVACFTP